MLNKKDEVMSACKKVKKWITKKVQIPVEKAITKAKKQCEEVKKKIEEKVKKPIEDWVSKQEKKCKKRKCKKWCICCNKWFCWIVTVVVKVVTWVLVTVIKWVTYWVCKIVMVVVDVIVKIIVRLLKFLITFIVCLFTDPLEALKAIWELWKDILDIVETIFDFIKGLVCDLMEYINDFKRLTCSLTESFGWIGRVLFGFVDGAMSSVKQIIGTACNLLEGIKDTIFGILNLNGCRISEGLTNIGVGIGRIILVAFGVIGWVLVSGIASNVRKKKLKEAIDFALSEAFTGDEDRIERIKDKMRFYSCPMGLPVQIDARRMCIKSDRYLQALHVNGFVNLYALAGQINGCAGKKWATQTASVNGEVVYTGTDIRVSYFDIKRFIEEGPESVPEFNVYPIKLSAYENALRVAKEKAYQLGLELWWNEIEDYPINLRTDGSFRYVPMNTDFHEEVFSNFPRNGTDDPLCKVPSLALFQYLDDEPSFGLTSWYRPPTYIPSCSCSDDKCCGPSSYDANGGYARKSGVSFTDRTPKYIFETVLVHELGHYFGLCHCGHDGLEYIMYSPAKSKKTITGNTFLEFLLLSGGPSFTIDDAKETWKWLTQVAQNTCLFP